MNINYKHEVRIIIFLIIFLVIKQDMRVTNFYQNITIIKNPNDNLVLINKFNCLDNMYIPNDLEKIDLNYATNYKYLRKNAKFAFEKMGNQAKQHGLNIMAVSAFRSFRYQNDLYNRYVNDKGLDYADKASARPGHSEHQSGLSVDVMGANGDYNLFENTDEFNWLKNNAHKYGFIMRYPKHKEFITGFKYEPWHYRYVGIYSALEIYNKNITLEEYLK